MTTNQAIDGVAGLRELLESIAAYVADSPNAIMRARAMQLRALLDATAVLGEIDLTPKRLEHAESVIEQQNNLIASLRAELVESYRVTAQPQGDPTQENRETLIG